MKKIKGIIKALDKSPVLRGLTVAGIVLAADGIAKIMRASVEQPVAEEDLFFDGLEPIEVESEEITDEETDEAE